MLLAAGGTGGHLFPAFALAEELAQRGYAIDLATDMRGDKYRTGFPARAIHQIPSATLGGRSPMALARTGWMLSRGILKAYRLLGRLRPVAVVGFGGYPSFPPLVAASLRNIPTALHEQNAVLGRANRMLAGRVSAVATSFEQVGMLEGRAWSKARFTGNPVRNIVLEAMKQAYAAPTPDGPLHVLIFGGSQGARFFSDAMPPALVSLPEHIRARLRIVQQCREEDLDQVREVYAAAGIAAECATFFTDLPKRIADSHLVIGRAGASSVAELSVIGRPSLLVPLPHALDNDQLQNATSLDESGGAWCIEQKDLSAERLRSELLTLFSEPSKLVAAAEAAKRQGRPDAVLRLADLVEELAQA